MRPLVTRLPAWVRTQPLDAMFAVLGIPSAVATLTGVATSHALETLLPWWANRLWALCLLAGCIAWLAGLSGVRELEGRLVVTRLPVLLLGLQLLSMTCLVYAVAIVAVAGWDGVLAAYPLLVGTLATYIRRADLLCRRGGDGT
ncbi:hypothetical protein Ssi03_56800 [Sphaerisporangium siamense]|uniref:CHASE2 domain-containing sensor protein n=1 Tax=Sphaerisporangium siamense TaxID=795645 RepID=A0A7W7D4Q2_9ACTN|nr:hypothetical protein [Sphaerisporangium siamense]MBB4700275.1 CHASE2 domain-containing sensor protein [Sphaerisporangium siamense]GII87690.1 hypothetical protein Ssi03_56800 [Sphaerisporangium siamense]